MLPKVGPAVCPPLKLHKLVVKSDSDIVYPLLTRDKESSVHAPLFSPNSVTGANDNLDLIIVCNGFFVYSNGDQILDMKGNPIPELIDEAVQKVYGPDVKTCFDQYEVVMNEYRPRVKTYFDQYEEVMKKYSRK